MDMLSNQRKLIVYFTKTNRYILVISIHLNFVIISIFQNAIEKK